MYLKKNHLNAHNETRLVHYIKYWGFFSRHERSSERHQYELNVVKEWL